jgi:hypothetical protein
VTTTGLPKGLPGLASSSVRGGLAPKSGQEALGVNAGETVARPGPTDWMAGVS